MTETADCRNRWPVSRVTRSKSQARSTYNRLSRWYDLLAGGFESRFRDAAVDRLAPATGEIVLEIGFGTGHSIVALAGRVGESGKVCGIDLAEGMTEVTHSRVERAGLTDRVILVQGDAVHLPYAAGLFDGVLMAFTLELFDTPEIPLVLAECRRVLRQGGRIAIVALSRKGRPNVITSLYGWAHEKLPRYVDCRPILVQESLQDAGFHILQMDRLSLFGLPVELALAEVWASHVAPTGSVEASLPESTWLWAR